MTVMSVPDRLDRETPAELPGPRAAAIVARDQAVMSPSYTRAYPFVMARGRGCRVWDPDGAEFLDMTSGIAVTATGHSHPQVVEAIQRQAADFLHMSGTDFYYDVEVRLAERLVALAPGSAHKQVFLTNSGTESVEACLKLARFATRRHQLIAFSGSFHGRTMGSLSLTGSKAVQRSGFGPFLPGVVHVPFPDPYRPPLGSSPEACGRAVLHFIEQDLFARTLPPEDVAAVFVEPLQGEGGYIVPPADFLPGLRALCDRYGILLVADEIQTGVGRTGRWWGVEHSGVVPDLMAVAKGIASGMPLGAMVARHDLMTWEPGAHGNTFGGNPVSCAAALATLDVIEEEDLLANARAMGDRLLAGLRSLQTRHEAIGDVRGVGLWTAFELVADRVTRQPDRVLRDRVVDQAFHRRLLLLGCGKSAIRVAPALVVSSDEIDECLEKLDLALVAAAG
jgi:4-aminobutyrate aminotransferase